MQRALQLLVLIGLVIWGFILLKEQMPDFIPDIRISDAETDPRCQQFGQEGEGVHTLEYRDRIKQILAGCW